MKLDRKKIYVLKRKIKIHSLIHTLQMYFARRFWITYLLNNCNNVIRTKPTKFGTTVSCHYCAIKMKYPNQKSKDRTLPIKIDNVPKLCNSKSDHKNCDCHVVSS